MDKEFFWQLCNIESSDSRMSGISRDRLSSLKEFNFDTSELKIDLNQLKTLLANAFDLGYTCGWKDSKKEV